MLFTVGCMLANTSSNLGMTTCHDWCDEFTE